MSQESYYLGALDRASDNGGKTAGSKPSSTFTKALKLTEEKALILTTKTAFIDETLKFSSMRWAINQSMVSCTKLE